MTQNLLKHPGSYLKLKSVLKIAKKPPYIYWVFFTELKIVLKIDEKPPGSSLTLKICAKNVFKNPPKSFWFFFTELKYVLKIAEKPP